MSGIQQDLGSDHSFKGVFHLICCILGVLPAMYVCVSCQITVLKSQKRESYPLELELGREMVINRVGTGN